MNFATALLLFQVCGIFAAAITLAVLHFTRPVGVSAAEVEKYRSQFQTGPPPRREFIPPSPPLIDCPKCGALAGQWCSTFAPFAQYATCVERRSAVSVPRAVATGSVGGNPTVREGAAL